MVKEAKPSSRKAEAGEATYACSHCASVFGRADSRTRHVRTVHEKRKDHACPQCDYKTGRAGDLAGHVRAVHEQRKDHACPHCAAAFGKASNVTRHVRMVHEKRRDHACDHCAATFGTAGNLTRHLANGGGHKCAGGARQQQTAAPSRFQHRTNTPMRRLLWLLLSASAAQSTRAPPPPPCTVAAFGAVADNRTDNTAAFRAAAASSCDEIVVGPGVWLTGPFNLSSNTVLRVEGTISGSTDPRAYPVVTLLPVDESFRAPWKRNRQRQALVAAYFSTNVTVTGSGTIDGNGWPWWRNQTAQGCQGFHNASWRPDPATQAACLVQRPKLLEFVDCEGVVLRGASAAAPLTLRNSPFWTFHPVFCRGVRAQYVHFRAPRDHGNTDGIDPDSCDDVHVADCLVDVGDDAVSVKSGRHWKTGAKVAAQNYLFERVVILFRNFAIGSAVSGDVRNITFRDGVIGDDLGSSPWAIKIKTDSQEGGVVDGVYFRNVRIGNITYCGSSRFVFTPPHSAKDHCDPARPSGATMLGIGMGYASLAVTDPGTVTNIVFDGIYGVGPTGSSFSARGLPNNATADRHIVNVTLRNFSLATGGPFQCDLVDGLTVQQVGRWPSGSTCKKKPGGGK